MSIKDYLEVSSCWCIVCTRCDETDKLADTKENAYLKFQKEGWVETDQDILCPKCAKLLKEN